MFSWKYRILWRCQQDTVEFKIDCMTFPCQVVKYQYRTFCNNSNVLFARDAALPSSRSNLRVVGLHCTSSQRLYDDWNFPRTMLRSFFSDPYSAAAPETSTRTIRQSRSWIHDAFFALRCDDDNLNDVDASLTGACEANIGFFGRDGSSVLLSLRFPIYHVSSSDPRTLIFSKMEYWRVSWPTCSIRVVWRSIVCVCKDSCVLMDVTRIGLTVEKILWCVSSYCCFWRVIFIFSHVHLIVSLLIWPASQRRYNVLKDDQLKE